MNSLSAPISDMNIEGIHIETPAGNFTLGAGTLQAARTDWIIQQTNDHFDGKYKFDTAYVLQMVGTARRLDMREYVPSGTTVHVVLERDPAA